MSKSNRHILPLAIAAVCILLFWVFAVYILPGSTIFSRPAANYAEDTPTRQVVPAPGDTYEAAFRMPFERLFSITTEWDKDSLLTSSRIDMTLELISNGTVIHSQKIVTPNENFTLPKNTKLERSAVCTFRITVNNNDGGAILLLPADGETPMLTFNGNNYGAGTKSFFTIFLLLSSGIALFAVYYHGKNKDAFSTTVDLFDKVIIGIVVLESLLMISQYFDLFCIARSSDMILSSNKPINRFYDYLYDASVYDEASDFRMLHNYSPLLYLLMALLELPFKLLMPNAEPDFRYGRFSMMLNLIILLLLLLGAYLIGKLMDKYACSAKQKTFTILLYFTSSFIIYSVTGFGQLDIIYVCIFLWALQYYGKGNNRIFSLIISIGIAFKTLPIIAFIPLILLYNKKIRDIVINLGIALGFPALMYIIFCMGTKYGVIQDIVSLDYPFAEYLMGVKGTYLSLFVIAYALICLICYFVNISEAPRRDVLLYSGLVILSVYTAMLSFMTTWHPQWLTMYCVILAIVLPFYKNLTNLNLVVIVTECLLLIKNLIKGPDIKMLSNGLLTGSMYYSGTTFARMMSNISPYVGTVVTSIYVGTSFFLLFYLIRHIPCEKNLAQAPSEKNPAVASSEKKTVPAPAAEISDTLPMTEILLRLVPFQCVLLFFVWCYCFIG
ncbi:MAG: DUF2029 domain-containing protein [Clostridiales bacterium]|nr:DUF2029 domain-containing protein [Clostridiales bacterium]